MNNWKNPVFREGFWTGVKDALRIFSIPILLLIALNIFLYLSSCAPEPAPTAEPLPTYTAVPPEPTYTALPTLEPLPTHTPYPSPIPPTNTPEPTATSTYIPPTPVPVLVKVLGSAGKTLLRQVCDNINGYIYNNNGYPIISDCIYPLRGEVSDRIMYKAGNKIEVEECGDCVFKTVHGFYSNFQKIRIKADGGQYYVAVERGENGELLFILAGDVKLLP